MIGIISVFFAFSLVIFVHEFGHFYVGKRCGIGVKEFSIGFGPKILWFKDRSGVIWKFCLLPFGGFVKFEGDADVSSSNRMIDELNTSPNLFHNASIKARFLTVLAGPFANLVFSVFVFSSLIFFNGITNDAPIIGKVDTSPFQNLNLQRGDMILSVNNIPTNSFSDIYLQYSKVGEDKELELLVKRDKQTFSIIVYNLFQPVVKNVELLSPASRAGILVGDIILNVNGVGISSFAELKNFVQVSKGKPLVLNIWRDEREIEKTIVPKIKPMEKSDGSIEETLRIGIIGGFALEPEKKTPGLFLTLKLGLLTTGKVVSGSIKGLIEIVKGSISPKHLSGPIGIAHAITDVSKNGISPFFSLVALISTGIAVINLFPLPILDGGHLLLLIYEKLTGASPSAGFMHVFTLFGLLLILSLMLFATYNDLLRIIF